MTTPRFLQLHFLSSYPGALINRDDAGLAKRLPFGAATRTRISSQCLKRHWRMADDDRSIHRLALSEGIASHRSKEAIERMVSPRLHHKHATDIVDALEQELIKVIYGSKALDKKSRQALLLGSQEIDWLVDVAEGIASSVSGADGVAEAVKDFFGDKLQKANLKQLLKTQALAPGLEAALFGRMITSDPRANTDAAVHVAHAFTVHAEQPELDYFTAVDDLTGRSEDNEEGGSGAAGVFDTELTSGLYYGYVVIDIPLLVSNTTGCKRVDWANDDTDRTLASRVVENLVHLVATVSPGAKKGSTAPYSVSEAVLLEAGERQPRTLANAFRDPVALTGEPGTLAGRAANALKDELDDIDTMYGEGEVRFLAARKRMAFPGPQAVTLPELAERAAQLVRDAST